MAADRRERSDDRSTGSGDFDSRLSQARRRHGLDRSQAEEKREVARRGLGAGMRIATEILAALVVGTGGGIVLDRWLGTSPWLLILGFVLGCAAAFVNVLRTAKDLDRAAQAAKAETASGSGAGRHEKR